MTARRAEIVLASLRAHHMASTSWDTSEFGRVAKRWSLWDRHTRQRFTLYLTKDGSFYATRWRPDADQLELKGYALPRFTQLLTLLTFGD